MEKQHLSTRQTMEYLDCSRTHLFRLVKKGKLKPFYLGRKPYFTLTAINAAMTKVSEKIY